MVVFIDCWDGAFLWDVLQRTLKKNFPVDSYEIRFFVIENERGVRSLRLHNVTGPTRYMEGSHGTPRYNDVDMRPAREFFRENVLYMLEVLKAKPSPPVWVT